MPTLPNYQAPYTDETGYTWRSREEYERNSPELLRQRRNQTQADANLLFLRNAGVQNFNGQNIPGIELSPERMATANQFQQTEDRRFALGRQDMTQYAPASALPQFTGTPGAPNPNVAPNAAAYGAQQRANEQAQAARDPGVSGIMPPSFYQQRAQPMGGVAPQRAYVSSWGAPKQKEVRPWSPMPAYRR